MLEDVNTCPSIWATSDSISSLTSGQSELHGSITISSSISLTTNPGAQLHIGTSTLSWCNCSPSSMSMNAWLVWLDSSHQTLMTVSGAHTMWTIHCSTTTSGTQGCKEKCSPTLAEWFQTMATQTLNQVLKVQNLKTKSMKMNSLSEEHITGPRTLIQNGGRVGSRYTLKRFV